VCFGTKREQQQALAKNGRIVHGVMVGVIEGILPAGSEGVLGDDANQTPHAALRLQHDRGAQYTVRPKLDASAKADTGLVALSNALLEYAFGW